MSNHRTDEQWMARALRLAALGRHASPNPMVGCVLVGPSGAIVGEGYHARVGTPHAEALALQAAGGLAAGSTAYVTLEPCSHFGRTPPCAPALAEAGVARVVAAMTDPDTRVAGRGFALLRAAGIPVDVGVGEARARALNAAYIKHRVTGLPWIVLKTAMTLDGKIATHTGSSRWITGAIARRGVHRQLRDRCDAIVTGIGTVLADDPSLTTRLAHRSGRDPLRVVVDSHARTPVDSRLVGCAAQDGLTLIAVTEAAENENVAALEARGCRVWRLPEAAGGGVDLAALTARLGTDTGAIGVLIESGGRLAAGFLTAGLVDRWLGYIAPKVVGGANSPGPVGGAGVDSMEDALNASSWRVRRCGPDLVIDARFG